MALWQNPGWFDRKQRQMQLDEHIQKTRRTRYGLDEVSEEEKYRMVANHFTNVAPKYDFMNTLLSFGLHYSWKRAAVNMLSLKHGERLLDVCGGTGDLAEMAFSHTGKNGSVILYDMNFAMMDTGRQKRLKTKDRILYIQGNAERISFSDNSFDAVIVGFGVRNLTHLGQGFSEMHRVLKKGGRMVCLEFSRPDNPVFRWLYDFYSFNIMPFMGWLFTGSAKAYTCLPETIRMFPLADELLDLLEKTGFSNVHYRKMTGGIAIAHFGMKAE
ncbi:MAG: bifunctional demethylmenaquinone methyltransferase/2-methoxy-6-polyprenyl-1,4-benzoquinol methylase UbiE [Proteobacteria bacterium]|nr:bifunctional demethylmenaquinone methyltransferase/2-methoxy-6-polyprenyl-1,4-benzoquinol methylase UbiE [Pseudomonadota bacterium]MBU4469777.1 bifunctional demethylmenaquinone methyltransferase/2-methoxy-6-polyprenyl-1,4-benzoquinol methylase UbiE [Pseudomonadota bacterium]MCG2753012.1 bifunctional demethylmenaquinone methyltransferase/2-methoxy-6-polyprenyl-1,4-benzoquinol methylase UbiE [Desulfobacteraceae bacterium]